MVVSPTIRSRRGREIARKLFLKSACEVWGATELKLEVHHKDGNELNNVADNVLTVDRWCHAAVHPHKRKERQSIEYQKYGPDVIYILTTREG